MKILRAMIRPKMVRNRATCRAPHEAVDEAIALKKILPHGSGETLACGPRFLVTFTCSQVCKHMSPSCKQKLTSYAIAISSRGARCMHCDAFAPLLMQPLMASNRLPCKTFPRGSTLRGAGPQTAPNRIRRLQNCRSWTCVCSFLDSPRG